MRRATAAFACVVAATPATADSTFRALGVDVDGSLIYEVSGIGEGTGLAFSAIYDAPRDAGPPVLLGAADVSDDLEDVMAAQSLAAARAFEATRSLGSVKPVEISSTPEVTIAEIAGGGDPTCDALLGRPAGDIVLVSGDHVSPPVATSTELATSCPASFAVESLLEASGDTRWVVVRAALPGDGTAFRAIALP